MRCELLSQTSCQQTNALNCNDDQQHIGILAHHLKTRNLMTVSVSDV